MKHTPGPWVVTKTNGNNRVRVTSENGIVGVCTVHALLAKEANARLIAKAPEMYELLEQIANAYTKGGEWNPSDAIKILKEIDNDR